jgi:antitoxin HicB
LKFGHLCPIRDGEKRRVPAPGEALGGYIEHEFAIPQPSAARGRPCIVLDVITSAKLALAATLAELGLSKTAFARRLGVTEKVVRRLLDLDHASRIERLEQALGLLDRRLEVSVRSGQADTGSSVGIG